MKQIVRFVFQAGLAFSMLAGLMVMPLQAVQAAAPITLTVGTVVFDSKVTVTAANLPAADTFEVRLGASGMQGLDGSLVANFDTSDTSSTTRTMTFEIPSALYGVEKIDLRIDGLESKASAYTTFTNHSSNIVSNSGIGGIPTLTVLSYAADNSVTVRTSNLPADTDFVVRMGAGGTQGLGGSVAAGFNSGAGGTVVNTFSIPDSLFGTTPIDIRIDALGGYFASGTFSNLPSTALAAGVGGASSLAVTGVIGNSMLSFTARNLPANTTFTVRIGAAGSQGLGGNVVADFDTIDGGTFNYTVEIPTNLYGSEQLVLRVEAAAGYAVYTTFNNVTTP